MYVCGGTFFEVAAFVSGFDSAMVESPLRHQQEHSFNSFVAAFYSFPDKIYWPFIIRECSVDDESAIAALHQLLSKYVDASSTDSLDNLLAETVKRSESKPVPEQINVWRKFSRAMHRGIKSDIEKLILNHPHVDLLCDQYPDDVVPLMDEIADSYRVTLTSVSDDGNSATIRTADFGTIELKYVDGCWRIDASPIIELRMANEKQVNPSGEFDA
jgi:hypothetical protein